MIFSQMLLTSKLHFFLIRISQGIIAVIHLAIAQFVTHNYCGVVFHQICNYNLLVSNFSCSVDTFAIYIQIYLVQ